MENIKLEISEESLNMKTSSYYKQRSDEFFTHLS